MCTECTVYTFTYNRTCIQVDWHVYTHMNLEYKLMDEFVFEVQQHAPHQQKQEEENAGTSNALLVDP